jgi:Protein of unknown function (DUF742)
VPGRERAPDAGVGEVVYESASIRPYAVTGGRTRSKGELIPIEALVSVIRMPAVQLSTEKARIVELALTQYLSIAELSAHMHLPVGVVRVLVGDLVEEGHARVHGAVPSSYNPAATLSVLESVLDGISAL